MFRPGQVVRWLAVITLVLGVTAPSALAQGTGRLAGRAMDDEGNPLVGVAIKAEQSDTNRAALETTTDNSGRFSLIGFVTGLWTISATLEGYTPDTGTKRMRQRNNAPIDFVLSKIKHELVLALGEEVMAGLDPEAIQAELDAADSAFNTEDWDAALQGYTSLLSKLPILTNLQMQIGNTYQAKGEYEQAVAAYETLLVEEPDNENAKTQIARTRLAMGDLDAAEVADVVEELAAAVSGFNAAREDLYNLGELEFARGAVDEAEEWYEKASMVDPNWELPLFKLGLVFLNKGDMETAKEYFRKVIEVAPDSAAGAQAKATLDALP